MLRQLKRKNTNRSFNDGYILVTNISYKQMPMKSFRQKAFLARTSINQDKAKQIQNHLNDIEKENVRSEKP